MFVFLSVASRDRRRGHLHGKRGANIISVNGVNVDCRAQSIGTESTKKVLFFLDR
jgi:hypothetical protein